MRHRVVHICLIALFAGVIGAGGASQTKTVRTETTTYPARGSAVVERQITVTTTETQEESGGVVSGTVNVIGEIITPPFRAVGALLQAIF